MPNQPTGTEDLLSDTGASATFTNVGDKIGGLITATARRQARDYSTGQPDTWDDGSPKENIVITVDTGRPDPNIPDDDGIRSVYVKWWGEQAKALKDAIKAAGARGLIPGGHFEAEFVGLGESTKRGFSAPKIFHYTYQPPNPTGNLTAPAAPAGHLPPAPVAPPTPPAAPPSAPALPGALPTPPATWTPPAPPAPVPAPDPEAAQLVATIRSLIGAGWADHDIANHPSSPLAGRNVPLDAIAAIRSAS